MNDEIKQALHCCAEGCISGCPYHGVDSCTSYMAQQALEYIDSLEERLAIMQESMETLEKRNEPMLAVDIVDNSIDCVKVGICPACEETIANITVRPTKYCKYCGQAVKWEE